MKIFRSWLLSLTILSLALSCTACSRPPYTPAGEVSIKTSPARGDAGVEEVAELEMERASYPADGEVTLPIRLGIGHLSKGRADGEAYAYVTLSVWLDQNPTEQPDEVRRLEYPDWETEAYATTEPEGKPLWAYLIPFMPYYGDFYPLHRETVEVVIPADISFGFIRAELHMVDEQGNESFTDPLQLSFERIDGALVCTAS